MLTNNNLVIHAVSSHFTSFSSKLKDVFIDFCLFLSTLPPDKAHSLLIYFHVLFFQYFYSIMRHPGVCSPFFSFFSCCFYRRNSSLNNLDRFSCFFYVFVFSWFHGWERSRLTRVKILFWALPFGRQRLGVMATQFRWWVICAIYKTKLIFETGE